MRIVRVVWIDSMVLNEGGWLDLDDVPIAWEELRQESIGFVASDDQVLVLAQSRNQGVTSDNQGTRVCGVQVIPHSAILSIVPLKDDPSATEGMGSSDC